MRQCGHPSPGGGLRCERHEHPEHPEGHVWRLGDHNTERRGKEHT